MKIEKIKPMIDIKNHSLFKDMEVDSVLTNVFRIYLKKFVTLFIYSFVAVFLMQLVFYQLGFWEMYKVSFTDTEDFLRIYSQLMGKIAIVSVTSIVIYGVLNSFLVNYLIKGDLDPSLSSGEIFGESVKKYAIHMIFFLILSTLILIAGMFVGIIAFIIGMFFALIYLGTVLIPGGTIVVAEDKNAIEAIGRTFKLVHKDFWPVLGSLVLFVLIMILISLVLTAVMAIPFVISFIDNWGEVENVAEMFNTNFYDIGIWSVILNSLVSAATYPLYAIISVVLYFKLIYKENKSLPQENIE